MEWGNEICVKYIYNHVSFDTLSSNGREMNEMKWMEDWKQYIQVQLNCHLLSLVTISLFVYLFPFLFASLFLSSSSSSLHSFLWNALSFELSYTFTSNEWMNEWMARTLPFKTTPPWSIQILSISFPLSLSLSLSIFNWASKQTLLDSLINCSFIQSI